MIASDLTSKTPPAYAESSATLSALRPASVVEEKSLPLLLPQSLGKLFDAAFDLYKSHFAVLALIVALVFIPTQIALHAASNLWVTPLSHQIRSDSQDQDFALQLGVALLRMLIGSPENGVPGILTLLISFLISGPVSLAVADIVLGRATT